ncbi:O-antigen ligase family protein [Vibrio intestinalis]|uniref:O-antigen ligase family protein n=1 Tax=Vibrio intestinalis TaxID=2933291 RepID=UPI0021A29AEB
MKNPLERYCFASLLLLLVWLPIPLGSNRIWAWTIAECWIGITALVLLFDAIRRASFTPLLRLKRYNWLLIPLALFQCWVALQLLPMPVTWLEWFSPSAAQAYQRVGAEVGYLSLDPRSTYISLLKGLNYLVFASCLAILTHSKKRLKAVMLALLVSGTIQAVYAALNVLLGTEQSWVFGLAETDIATGSFVYKNHLANYLLLCLSMGIGLIVIDMSRRQSHSWQERMFSLLQLVVSRKMMIRFALIIMVIALVMTRSRMGNAAFFAATLIAGVIALVCYKNRPTKLSFLIFSLFAVDILVLGSFFGLEQVQQRIMDSHLEQDTRYLVVDWSLPIVKDYLLTGTGLGSFYSVFPSYSHGAIGYYDHAHNDYLQFVIETGLPSFALLAFVVLWAFGMAIWVMKHRNSKTCKGAAFGCLIAFTAMMIHITVDFNLQAPANAVTFITILVLVGASYSIGTQRKQQETQLV